MGWDLWVFFPPEIWKMLLWNFRFSEVDSMKASSKATYPFIGVLGQLTTNAQRSFTSRILVDWCGWCGCDNHGLGCYGWYGMILWLLFWCHSLMSFWWYSQAAKLLRQRFQALKTKRDLEVWERLFVFFWGKDSLPHNPNLIGNNS